MSTSVLALRRRLATSDGLLPRVVRRLKKGVVSFSVPAPRAIVRPLFWSVVAVRTAWQFVLRVFVCEPMYKARFTRYGRNFRGDCYIPWIAGQGDIMVGDNVWFDGRVTLTFGARFADRPTLIIGDNTAIGHNSAIVVAKQITIGRDCNISGGCWIADSNGHPSDPSDRLARKPPAPDDVRPVVIGDGAWIGRQCLIFPGVKIGKGSIVSAGSVVRGHVPPFSVVAGNPAKVLLRLKPPASASSTADQ